MDAPGLAEPAQNRNELSPASPSTGRNDCDVSPQYVDLDLDSQSAARATPASKASFDSDLDNARGGCDGDALKPQLVGRAENGQGGSPSTAASSLPTVRSMDEAAEAAELQVTRARKVSIASLVASVVAACLGLGIGVSEEVLSLVGFGVESLLDGISSALVLWRFKRGKKRQHADMDAAMRHKMQRDARRERNSAIGIGATFVASACILLTSSVIKWLAYDPDDPTHKQEENSGAYYGTLLSWPSAFVFGGLAAVKFRLARELQSQVLKKDAFCSVLGAILALIVAIASLIELAASDNPKGMELVDVFAGLMIALLLGIEGVRTLWHNLPGIWESQHQPMN